MSRLKTKGKCLQKSFKDIKNLTHYWTNNKKNHEQKQQTRILKVKDKYRFIGFLKCLSEYTKVLCLCLAAKHLFVLEFHFNHCF